MNPRLLLSLFVIGFTLAATAVAEETDFCHRTSQAALRSCRSGADSDYWLALGNCDNVSDPAARKTCKQQALADSRDAQVTCNDQHSARQAACERLGDDPYDPVIDPENFVDKIDNPYFPLTPGTTYIYEGRTPDGFEHSEFAVTKNTIQIMGVSCVEVYDTAKVNGELVEDTLDWFAQDREGNVWYFGENTRQLSGGLIVGLEGTWTGGVDSAKPGIIMKAHPVIGDFYRQEFSLATAEDLAGVTSLDKTAVVRAGTFHHCLQTRDISSTKVGDVELKYYAPGVGNVLVTSSGERLELVRVTRQ